MLAIHTPTSPADVKSALALARAMHAESAYAFLPFDAAKVTASILACATLPEHFAALAILDERPVGFLGGRLSEYPFCREKLAHDIAFFVVSDARRSTAAARLLRAFIAWARDNGARELSIGTSTGHDVERVSRFLERAGLPRVGAVHRGRLG